MLESFHLVVRDYLDSPRRRGNFLDTLVTRKDYTAGAKLLKAGGVVRLINPKMTSLPLENFVPRSEKNT